MIQLDMIDVNSIAPSPFQSRTYFDKGKLRELANSISRDGLIEPIVIRPMGKGYELIAGERRLRASKLADCPDILSRIVEVSDKQARRMCAAENMQRDDLSPVETVWAIVEMVDSELIDFDDYELFGEEPVKRVGYLLKKLDSDHVNKTDKFIHKFMYKMEAIFKTLPKPVKWRSFYNNDFKPALKIDDDVAEIAAKTNLNKSQTKEVQKVKDNAPDLFESIVKQSQDEETDEIIIEVSTGLFESEQVPLGEVSARELEKKAKQESSNVNYKPKENIAGDIWEASPLDHCQTPPYAVDPLIKYLPDSIIWEPASADGYLSGALLDGGHRVVTSRIQDGQNFFDYEPDNWEVQVTNPPYSIKYDWLKRSYELEKPFALLLPVETLGAKSGQELFKEYGIEVIFLSSRVDFKMPFKGWEGGAQFPVAWFTWGLDIGQQITFEDMDKVKMDE